MKEGAPEAMHFRYLNIYFCFFDVVPQMVRSTLLDFGLVWANDEISELSVFFEKIKLFDILFKFFDFLTDYFQNSIPIEN